MSYSILDKNGDPLDPSLYTISNKDKTFYCKEDNLVLDFKGSGFWRYRFIIGKGCIISGVHNTVIISGDGCYYRYITYGWKPSEIRKEFNISLSPGIYNIILNEKIVNIKDKNDALLNIKYDHRFVRACCRGILKDKLI
jgi:hypothetical protein